VPGLSGDTPPGTKLRFADARVCSPSPSTPLSFVCHRSSLSPSRALPPSLSLSLPEAPSPSHSPARSLTHPPQVVAGVLLLEPGTCRVEGGVVAAMRGEWETARVSGGRPGRLMWRRARPH
jgi:hypothetical protein